MENLIIELQEIVTHQREDIDNLSAEFYAQQKEIAELRLLVQKLLTKAQDDSGNDSGIRMVSEETPPPHY